MVELEHMDVNNGPVVHPYPYARGEFCMHCQHFRGRRTPATHKVEESAVDRHGMSAYLCCDHFQHLFGPSAKSWAGCV